MSNFIDRRNPPNHPAAREFAKKTEWAKRPSRLPIWEIPREIGARQPDFPVFSHSEKKKRLTHKHRELRPE